METRGLCIKENVRHGETIEKEALASTCMGMREICTIHPREILCDRGRSQTTCATPRRKNLDSMPPRILRFRLRLDRFQFSIGHMSQERSCYTQQTPCHELPQGRAMTVRSYSRRRQSFSWNHLPASKGRLEEYKTAQLTDHICSKVGNSCQNGCMRAQHSVWWPGIKSEKWWRDVKFVPSREASHSYSKCTVQTVKNY